jgi:hypothetical protein
MAAGLSRKRLRRRAARALLALSALAMPLSLRAQASPYVPLDDPAYAYVDALLARGHLDGLIALERPYSVAALRAALAAAPEPDGVPGGWARALRQRLALHDTRPSPAPDTAPALHGVLALGAFATGESSARRELMLADDEAGAHPGAHLRVAAATGSVVVGARLVADQRLREDPEYDGVQDTRIAGRVEEAYVAGQWRFGELFFGRLARNWGPAGLAGLQLGDDAYSYDHLFARLGTERLRLMTVIARLDEAPGLYDPLVQRFLSVHRLAARWGDVELAATETYVYSGAERGFEPGLANPLAPVLLPHYNDEDLDGNVSFGLDVLWRSPVGVLAAQGMVDDFQFERGTVTTEEPASYGVTLSAEGVPLVGQHRAFASYTRVTNLTYRTGNVGDSYIVQGVSIGRGASDYDEVRAGLDLALLPAMPLRVYGARRRQGEGDYRLPFPAPEEFAETPSFLAGRVSTITRVGVSGAGTLGAGVAVDVDAGFNRVSGFGQAYTLGGLRALAGSGFAGRLRVTVEPSLLRRRFTLF